MGHPRAAHRINNARYWAKYVCTWQDLPIAGPMGDPCVTMGSPWATHGLSLPAHGLTMDRP